MVTNLSPRNPNVSKLIRDNWNIMNMYEHFRSVLNKKLHNSTPVSGHFSSPKHSCKNMEFSVLHRMRDDSYPDDTKGCRGHELFYIWAFPTLHPADINIFVWGIVILLHN